MAAKQAPKKKAQVKTPQGMGDEPPVSEPCGCCCETPYPNPCTEGAFYVQVWQCVEGVRGGCSWLDVDSIVDRVVEKVMKRLAAGPGAG